METETNAQAAEDLKVSDIKTIANRVAKHMWFNPFKTLVVIAPVFRDSREIIKEIAKKAKTELTKETHCSKTTVGASQIYAVPTLEVYSMEYSNDDWQLLLFDINSFPETLVSKVKGIDINTFE